MKQFFFYLQTFPILFKSISYDDEKKLRNNLPIQFT